MTLADIKVVRSQFPILSVRVHEKPLVYLDSAATAQKPESVIRAVDDYYRFYNANVHRGVHYLSQVATERMEQVRIGLKSFIGASSEREIIFTSGTTDAINLVAQSWGRMNIKAGDNILISVTEHHANIVPWQMLATVVGAEVRAIPITSEGVWDLSTLGTLIDQRTKLVAVGHVSNALGSVQPVEVLIGAAKHLGATVLLDGAQAVPHLAVNVQELGCDFYCFSAHKMFGPTGIGVLWGREELLNQMPPWRGGGEMIDRVSLTQGTTFNILPFKFEAGTPNIAGIMGLGAALDFMTELSFESIGMIENGLIRMATEGLQSFSGITIYGPDTHKVPVVSFNFSGIHHSDLGILLDRQGIAVRTGHHCTQPLMESLGIQGTVRASFSIYNNEEDVVRLLKATELALGMLR